MPVKPIPDGYHTITPYLMVEDAAALVEFLKRAFGAVEVHRSAMPDGRLHVDLTIGDSHIMLGEPMGPFKPMPASLYLYVPDTDATYKQALAAGAESVMEPADQFYGDRNAGVRDAHGNLWWIGTHIEDVSHEEIALRQHKMTGGGQGSG